MKVDTLVRGGQVVTAEAGAVRRDIAITDGRISALLEDSGGVETREVIDAAGKHVFPGLIDPHTHLGLANGVEDFTTETRSAALGGVTTVITFFRDYKRWKEYPVAFQEYMADLSGRLCVDLAVHVVVVARGHLKLIERFSRSHGVPSFKLYLTHRGEESRHLGFPPLDDSMLFSFLEQVARVPGGVLAVHAENIEVMTLLRRRLEKTGRDDLRVLDESRPGWVEAESIQRAIHFARVTNCPIYLLHTSSGESLEVAKNHRQRFGNPIYVETCPHYLTHTRDDGLGGLGKVNPPLRGAEDVEASWQAIADGTVDTVGSDHVPRRKKAKLRSIWEASGGFAGIATILPVLLSEGVHRRGLGLGRVVELTATNPARIFGLYPRKGTIAVGSDADLAIVDLKLERTVRAEDLGSYCDYSVYEGHTLKGWPVRTILRGKTVMKDGAFLGAPGYGTYLPRNPGPGPLGHESHERSAKDTESPGRV